MVTKNGNRRADACQHGKYNLKQTSKKTKILTDHLPKVGPLFKSEFQIHRQGQDQKQSPCGQPTGKYIAGPLGGAAATIAIPNAMRFRSWGDVMGSSTVAIGGGIAVKQMDEGADI